MRPPLCGLRRTDRSLNYGGRVGKAAQRSRRATLPRTSRSSFPDAPLSDGSAVLTDGRIPSTLKARPRRLKTAIVRPHINFSQFYFLYSPWRAFGFRIGGFFEFAGKNFVSCTDPVGDCASRERQGLRTKWFRWPSRLGLFVGPERQGAAARRQAQ